MSKSPCCSCIHFEWCHWLIGAQAGDECDWEPSRHRPGEQAGRSDDPTPTQSTDAPSVSLSSTGHTMPPTR